MQAADEGCATKDANKQEGCLQKFTAKFLCRAFQFPSCFCSKILEFDSQQVPWACALEHIGRPGCSRSLGMGNTKAKPQNAKLDEKLPYHTQWQRMLAQ